MTTEPILETRLAPAPATPPPVGPRFTVGTVLGRSLEAWWRHLGAFTLTSLAVYAPAAAALSLVSGFALGPQSGAPPRGAPAGLVAGFVAAAAATVALAVVQAGAVTFATARHLVGEPAPLREMLGAAVRRGPSVLGVGLLVWGAVLGASLLLVVPGVLLMVATSVSVPVAVLERAGPVRAFRRSLALTRGARVPLFAAGLALLVVVWVLAAAVQVGAMAAVALLVPSRWALAGTLLASQLGNALFAPLPVVAMAVAYHELRVAKEGVDTATLARVFE